MEDYLQEYLLTRVVGAHGELAVLGDVLLLGAQSALRQAAQPPLPPPLGMPQGVDNPFAGTGSLPPPPLPPPQTGALEQDSDVEMAPVQAALREPRGPPRAAWASLDEIDLAMELRQRVPCLKAVPKFLRSGVRAAYRLALDAMQRAYRHGGTEVCRVRAWKLLMLVSRAILHKRLGEPTLPKELLLERADRFQRGEWRDLLAEARACSSSPSPRVQGSPPEARVCT